MNTAHALYALAFLAVTATIGVIILAVVDKQVPDVLPLIATTAVGAIGGILVPTKGGGVD